MQCNVDRLINFNTFVVRVPIFTFFGLLEMIYSVIMHFINIKINITIMQPNFMFKKKKKKKEQQINHLNMVLHTQ